jgi:hypothetical protein
MSRSFQALREENPRAHEGFAAAVDAVADVVRAQIAGDETPGRPLRSRRRLGLVRVSLASATVAVVAAVGAFLAVGSLSGGPGVENATAAVAKAATQTASSADRSGTAVVRMTLNGAPWAAKTIRWNGGDLEVVREKPEVVGRPWTEFLLVDGDLYGVEPDGVGWVNFGSPKHIDPDSGTTPDELLAATREDVGGVTLRRISKAIRGLTTSELADGSVVYRGTVASGVIARETGFKEGQAFRVLPFGYVAHDEAANAASQLDIAVTVGADGIVREIALTWGTWTYTVSYSDLGSTAAPVAPANARTIEELRGISRQG